MSRISLAYIAGLVGMTILYSLIGPTPQLGPSYPWALLASGGALLIFGGGVSYGIRRFKRRKAGPDAAAKAHRRALPIRGFICVGSVAILEVLFARFAAPFLSPFWLSEAIYYGMLIAAGVLIATWARCGSHFAITAAVLSLLCIAAAEYISYGSGLNLTAALGDFSTMFLMWPLDTAVALSSWLIAAAFAD